MELSDSDQDFKDFTRVNASELMTWAPLVPSIDWTLDQTMCPTTKSPSEVTTYFSAFGKKTGDYRDGRE